MPACDQVKLLLGPFDDGELEPHEMEDVAFHVVSCATCKAALEDYRSLGVALRDSFSMPVAKGFTDAVLGRIAQVPQPLWRRLTSYLDAIGERVGKGMAIAATAALAALVTTVVVTPYAQRLLHGVNRAPAASSSSSVAEEQHGFGSPGQPANNFSDASFAADESMITLSDDPTTTVIWIPDQP